MWSIFKKKELKPFLVKYDYILEGKSTIILAEDRNKAITKFIRDFKNRYYKIKEVSKFPRKKIKNSRKI